MRWSGWRHPETDLGWLSVPVVLAMWYWPLLSIILRWGGQESTLVSLGSGKGCWSDVGVEFLILCEILLASQGSFAYKTEDERMHSNWLCIYWRMKLISPLSITCVWWMLNRGSRRLLQRTYSWFIRESFLLFWVVPVLWSTGCNNVDLGITSCK